MKNSQNCWATTRRDVTTWRGVQVVPQAGNAHNASTLYTSDLRTAPHPGCGLPAWSNHTIALTPSTVDPPWTYCSVCPVRKSTFRGPRRVV